MHAPLPNFLAPLALAAALALPVAAPAAGPADFIRLTPDRLNWKPVPGGHGSAQAVLYGDPSKPGVYVVRMRFAPHWMDAPHFHSQDRYVTVLKGTWMAGTGARFDLAHAQAMPAGSLMIHPAGGPHWDGSASDEEAIVQIIGVGPVSTTQIDPKAPGWIHVGAAGGPEAEPGRKGSP